MKAESLFYQLAQNQMDGEFCESHSAPFVDYECKRGAWLSSRGALSMRPVSNLYNVIDSRRYAVQKFFRDAESIGVQFNTKNEIAVKVGHGHITIRCDGLIENGWPDQGGRMIVKFRNVAKHELAEIRDNGISEQSRNQAQMLMASGGIRNTLFVTYCEFVGVYHFAIVNYNEELARAIWNTTNAGVESDEAPAQLPTVNNELNPRCETCSFAAVCMAPIIPSTTCRSCRHSQFGPNGSLTCLPNNGYELNSENIMNLHKCGYHRYRAGLIASWASPEGGNDNNEFVYTNMLNGTKFINGEGEGKYTSYEMNSIKGKNPASLVGESTIEKLKTMFGATLE